MKTLDLNAEQKRYFIDKYQAKTRTLSEDNMFTGDRCIVWTGTLDRLGYGAIWIPKRWKSDLKMSQTCAHRVFYAVFNGPVGPLDVAHRCHNRACVNPRHLEMATRKDNCAGRPDCKVIAGRCRNGHPASQFETGANGKSVCPACRRESAARGIETRRQRNKLAKQAREAS